MERLLFVCPSTGQGVDVGIESDIGTLLRIRRNTVCAKCPACGQMHEWRVGDARLTRAAESSEIRPTPDHNPDRGARANPPITA